MPKLPLVSSKQAIKVFQKLNYKVVRQKGSHIRMHHLFDKTKSPLTIPKHRVIGRGLLRKLMRDAKTTPEDFNKLLK